MGRDNVLAVLIYVLVQIHMCEPHESELQQNQKCGQNQTNVRYLRCLLDTSHHQLKLNEIPSGNIVDIKAAGRQTCMSSHGVQHTFWAFPWPCFVSKPLGVKIICVIWSTFQAERQLWHHQSQTWCCSHLQHWRVT